MTVKSYCRGWATLWLDGQWVYADDLTSCETERPCVRCEEMPTKDGHDACLGHLPNVEYACCGHGVTTRYERPYSGNQNAN